ncbi:hypothetical protein H1R20_g6470, partial [Candolleomyces eurysporus]
MPVTVGVAVAILYFLSIFSFDHGCMASTTPSATERPTRTSAARTSSATGTPTAAVAGRKNPKRGLAFAAELPGDILNVNQTASVISWQYDWANLPPAYLATSNIKYIPMQWGSGSIDRFVDAVRAQGADTILAFNEPDFVNEANMDPTEAARLWMAYIEPLKQYGVRLGGPAVTAAGTGRPWLQQFFAACGECSIDFLPIHWYGVGTSGFYDYLWTIHNEYPRLPVWVTEYADTSDNETEVLSFMNETMRYMDDLEWIERYAWFGLFRPKSGVHYNLLREDGGLNALGELYTGAKTVYTQYIKDTTFEGYKTVDGADIPNQPLVTSWPVYMTASGARPSRWVILGTDTPSLVISLVAISIGSLMSGVYWTVW